MSYYSVGNRVRCSTAYFSCLVQVVGKKQVTQESTLFIKENKLKNVFNKV